MKKKKKKGVKAKKKSVKKASTKKKSVKKAKEPKQKKTDHTTTAKKPAFQHRTKYTDSLENKPLPRKRRRSKKFVFQGYCSKCNCMIMEGDKLSKFIYHCPSCGNEERIKNLKNNIPKKKNKPLS